MNALQSVQALLDGAPEAIVVASLGTATSALRAASDDGPHLYMGGSMGSALAVAIGVAEKRRERRVLAVLGDGEALMGAGTLWTLAGASLPNLTAAVLCDGHYSITGGQSMGVPTAFAEVGRALGLTTASAETAEEIVQHLRRTEPPSLIEIRYAERGWLGPSPFVDPPVVRWRFGRALDGIGGT